MKAYSLVGHRGGAIKPVIALTVCVLGMCEPHHALAQKTGIRANPTTYVTYNDVTAAFDLRAQEMSLNANNPPLSTYNPIATPPPAQFSFLQTSDGENLLSALRSDTNGKLLDSLPGAPAAGKNPTFGGLVAGRAWNAADIMMGQCFSGGFAWNIQGSLQPGGGGVGVQNTIPYTFASAANFNELSWESQQPNINAPPTGAGATTAIGGFTQGHAWANWNTMALPANNSTARYRAYQVSIQGGFVGGVREGGDPFAADNKTAAWGNVDSFNLAGKAFESSIYASPDAPAGGAVNAAGANNGRTMTQDPAHPTFAVLAAFSATNDNRFVLDLERQYVALRSDGIPANQIAVLYGDGTVGQLKSFPNIAAANRKPDFGGLYTAGFTMPVNGGTSLANLRSLLNGTGWAGLGLAPLAAGANLYLYTTGHGGAVNIAGVPIATNQAGNTVITTMTLSGPPNPAPKTDLQIASSSLVAPDVLARILSDTILVDGNPVPGNLAVEASPFSISSLVPMSPGQPLYYYSITVPQPYFSFDGDGTYTLGLQENGSFASSDLATFVHSVVGVTMITDMEADVDSGARLSNNVDTYTDLVVPEPAALALILIAAVAAFPARRLRRA